MRNMRDFAPTRFEQEVIRCIAEKAKVKMDDCWCGECGVYRYSITVNGKPDYLCLTCRLGLRK